MKINRMIHNVVIVTALSILGMMFYYLMYFLTDASFRQEWEYSFSDATVFFDFLASCSFTTIVTLYYWKTRERAEKERDRLRLQVLDNQLSPHFVFNNFSILAELIEVNPPKASEYLMHISKVYRYILTHQDHPTVSVQDELQFLKHYISLLEERFGDCVQVIMDLDIINQEGRLPPAVLQMLIENAIKHNEHTSEHPLIICISGSKSHICVKNVKQPIAVTESAKVGLHNIEERYHLLAQNNIVIENSDTSFSVTLPIIKE